MLRRRFISLGVVPLAAMLGACSPAAKTSQAPASSGAAKKPVTFAEIAAYQGADRQQMLEEGAKQEGTLTWYTTIAGDVLDAEIKAFEQKYPYVKVQLFRTDTVPLQTKLIEEAKSKKYVADVTETGQDQALVLRDELKVLQPWFSPIIKTRQPSGLSPTGDGMTYWILDSESYVGFAYNTNAIPESAVPKTWKDILNPALKGKMQVSGTSTGVTWTGNLISNQGEAFVQQVAKQQDIKVQQISGKALNDLVASGEVAASPAIYRDHAQQSMEKGAPVKWVPLDPVTTGPYAVAVVNAFPHPHAGMLFADFLASEDGGKIMSNYHYGSSANEAGFVRWRAAEGLSATQYEQKFNQWQDTFQKLFVQK
ncbi:MAG TPA: extracellular solute-binding protein [Dehalococcoidia bacterium]|nr:extracellular solute-binding protein [Dehalococcoidia bacterium]